MSGATLDLCIDAKDARAPGGGVRPVLRNVRFSAAPGEVLALFGRSGVGKTTTLRVALGLDAAFRGWVRRPPGRIGAVFQEPRLLNWLTVAENLRLVVGEGMPAPDITRLLHDVELEGIERRRPGELSLGMARRVALARALVVEPQFLVLDEPFASLDAALAARLAGLVSDWARRRGTTVLLATHDLEQALGVADRILVLAGEPAGLAGDFAVPDRGDGGALADLRAALVTRFPFLARAEAAV